MSPASQPIFGMYCKIVANPAPQMFYGEDGVDVMNINYMQKFEFLAKNAVTFARRLDLPNALLAGKVRSHFCIPLVSGLMCARARLLSHYDWHGAVGCRFRHEFMFLAPLHTEGVWPLTEYDTNHTSLKSTLLVISRAWDSWL